MGWVGFFEMVYIYISGLRMCTRKTKKEPPVFKAVIQL